MYACAHRCSAHDPCMCEVSEESLRELVLSYQQVWVLRIILVFRLGEKSFLNPLNHVCQPQSVFFFVFFFKSLLRVWEMTQWVK